MLQSPCSIITIGNFDGVHLGHCHVISHLKKFSTSFEYRKKFFVENPELLKQYRLDLAQNPASCLLTFKPHPAAVLGNKFYIPLMTYEKRLSALEEFNLHIIEEIPFGKEFANRSSEEFCEFLVRKYHIAMLFIGHDLKIGRDRAGRDKLTELGRKLGFAVYAHEALTLDCSGFDDIAGSSAVNVTGLGQNEEIISSTKIREALLQGNIPKANAMLGYAYSLSGTVRHGFNRGGKLLGFPTANLLEDTLIVPKNGVYATKARVFDPRFHDFGVPREYHAMTNIGYNPTFGGEARSIETFIFDFDADIYDCDIEISFYRFLREEQKFQNIGQLIVQLNTDKENAQRVLTGK